MAEILSTDDRAIQVLMKNRYFALATVDESGPWVAALAFVPAASPPRLYWMSRTWARHSMAIEQDNRVSGVIYDSTANIFEVESIQFSGTCRKVINKDELRIVLRGHPAEHPDEPDENALQKILANPELAAYCVTIEDAYVLDQTAWLNYEIDAREGTNANKVFATYLDSFEQELAKE